MISTALILREGRTHKCAAASGRFVTPYIHRLSVRRNNCSVTATSMRRQRILLLSAIALVAFNLRTALTSVPTVVVDIQRATGMNDIAVGALTTLPVIAMGAIALAMLSEYSRDAASSARLTAMAFSVTFLVAALGPLLTGVVLQWSGSWAVVYVLLAIVCAGQLPPIIRLRRGIIID